MQHFPCLAMLSNRVSITLISSTKRKDNIADQRERAIQETSMIKSRTASMLWCKESLCHSDLCWKLEKIEASASEFRNGMDQFPLLYVITGVFEVKAPFLCPDRAFGAFTVLWRRFVFGALHYNGENGELCQNCGFPFHSVRYVNSAFVRSPFRCQFWGEEDESFFGVITSHAGWTIQLHFHLKFRSNISYRVQTNDRLDSNATKLGDLKRYTYVCLEGFFYSLSVTNCYDPSISYVMIKWSVSSQAS